MTKTMASPLGVLPMPLILPIASVHLASLYSVKLSRILASALWHRGAGLAGDELVAFGADGGDMALIKGDKIAETPKKASNIKTFLGLSMG